MKAKVLGVVQVPFFIIYVLRCTIGSTHLCGVSETQSQKVIYMHDKGVAGGVCPPAIFFIGGRATAVNQRE